MKILGRVDKDGHAHYRHAKGKFYFSDDLKEKDFLRKILVMILNDPAKWLGYSKSKTVKINTCSLVEQWLDKDTCVYSIILMYYLNDEFDKITYKVFDSDMVELYRNNSF